MTGPIQPEPRVVFQDGQRREDGRVCLDVDDLSLARGLGVFETLRSHAGALRHLDLHLERLRASAEALQIPMPDAALLRAEIALAAAAIPGEVALRISLTAGGHRIVQARPLPAAPPSVRAVTLPQPEAPWLSGRVKHTSRATSVVALRASGVDEVIWVDRAGALLEGTWSNVFAVRGGVLYTPADDGRILPGITRRHVLAAAASLSIPSAEGPVPRAGPWEELYISSSLKMLCPIVELDGQPAPGEGPVGRRLQARLEQEYRP